MNNINVGDIVQTRTKNIYRVVEIKLYNKGCQRGSEFANCEFLFKNPDDYDKDDHIKLSCGISSLQKVDEKYCRKQINHWVRVLNIVGEYRL